MQEVRGSSPRATTPLPEAARRPGTVGGDVGYGRRGSRRCATAAAHTNVPVGPSPPPWPLPRLAGGVARRRPWRAQFRAHCCTCIRLANGTVCRNPSRPATALTPLRATLRPQTDDSLQIPHWIASVAPTTRPCCVRRRTRERRSASGHCPHARLCTLRVSREYYTAFRSSGTAHPTGRGAS